MLLYNKILDKFKLQSTKKKDYWNNVYIPKYIPDNSWIQDSDKSITNNGKYDLKNFSEHESATIKHVLSVAREKYPDEYQAIGLANESYQIKYKPRYILFEIIILLYEKSESDIDKFAVSLAYASKGAYYRKKAIEYFEESEPYISGDFMQDFLSYMPLHVYTIFADIYEKEHEYKKAIDCIKIAQNYGEPGNPNFDNRISNLLEKQQTNPKRRETKQSQSSIEFENDVTTAAKHFLYGTPLSDNKVSEIQNKEKPKKRKRKMSSYELERFAIECNARMEREDERAQYEEYEN